MVAPQQRAQAPLDTTAAIETPEHVRFAVKIAGPTSRAIAYLLDTLVRGLALLLLAIPLLASQGSEDLENASAGMLMVALFVLEWGYYVLFESLWSGTTPGKRALGLRVVKEGGVPVTFVDVVLRNLLRAADWLPGMYAVGVLVMSIDPRFRRLGDWVAGTIVVSESRGSAVHAVQVHPTPTPQELDAVPSNISLSGAELDALELFVRRMPLLGYERGNELADLVAPMFLRRCGLGRVDNPARFLAVIYHQVTRSMVPTGLIMSARTRRQRSR